MFNQSEFVYGIAVSSSSLLFAMAVLTGFLLLAILVSLMRIYKKAGKPSISAIIPIWSQVVLFQIVDKPWWYLFLLLIPIANIVILIQAYILLAKKFGKGVGFGIAMCFLPMIFIPLLSFYDYVGLNSTDAANEESEQIYNPFNQTEVNQVMPAAPHGEESNLVVQPEVKENIYVANDPIQENLNTQVDVVNDNVAIVQNDVPVIQEIPVQPSQEISNIQLEIPSQPNEVLLENQNMDIPVIPNVDLNINANVVVNEEINKESQVMPGENQDIQSVLNTNNLEPKNVAFNSTPIVVEPETGNLEQIETLEPLNENKVLETTVIENNEVIEMPEIAAKTCPACGISLAEDIKFCTSCGTQL